MLLPTRHQTSSAHRSERNEAYEASSGWRRRKAIARTSPAAGEDAVTVHPGGGTGDGCPLLTARARPLEGTNHSSSSHKCSIRATMYRQLREAMGTGQGRRKRRGVIIAAKRRAVSPELITDRSDQVRRLFSGGNR